MSTNISKAKREELLKQVAEIRNKLMEHQDENTNQLLVYLSNIEKDINGKKYGLVFEEHREAVDELLENNVPVLIEDESLKIDNGGQQNFLIEGDNLASLKLLEKTHKGKIDFIYIDPPYNTGHDDFVYDDDIVGIDDKFRHSKWLSFLSKRIEIAYKLLSPKGVLFVSIDDNESSQLKLLCDSVFQEDNYLGAITWLKKRKGSFLSKKIISLTEYIHVYSKNASEVKLFGGKPDESESQPIIKRTNKISQLTFLANTVKTKLKDGLYKAGTYGERVNPVKLVFDCEVRNGIFITDVILEAPFTWSQAFLNEELVKGTKVVINTKNLQPRVFRKINDNSFKGFSSIIHGVNINATNEDAYEELEEIFGVKKIFDYSKPKNLICELLNATTYFDKNAICLDFFAGSGTTGHAVMKLNAEDGGKRKFILCTNNENNICRDITYERIKRVIAKEDYKASLKYYKVDYVPITEQVYYEYADKLLLHIKELVELENNLDFDGNKKVAICLTDENLQEFTSSLNDSTTYKAVYVGHDVFVTPEIESKLNSSGIKINIIPDYYYGELRG